MVKISTIVFFLIMALGASFMVWVLWKTTADERRRHHHHDMPVRRY